MSQKDPESLVNELLQALDEGQLHSPDVLGSLSLHKLDVTRAAFNRMLHAVNVAHNSKVRINTVIRDVIYHIFVMTVFSCENPVTAVRQSLDISHVCHQWRELALDCPVIWAFVDLRYSRVSKLLLERAAMAPLDLTISDRAITPYRSHSYNLPIWRKHLSTIPTLIPRIRSLTLHVEDPEHAKEILGYFRDASTSLHLHTLDICLPMQADSPVQNTPPTLVPDFFFNAPHLPQSLILQRTVLAWDNPVIHGLTTLVLLELTVPPTLQQLMSLLSTCPGLEELEMKWIFTEAPVTPPAELSVDTETLEYKGQIVNLVHLWKLSFSLMTSTCHPFFGNFSAHIHAPALKSLSITSPYYETTTTPHPFDMLPSNPPYPFSTLKHVQISQGNSYRSCTLKGRATYDGHPLPVWDETNLDLLLRSPGNFGVERTDSSFLNEIVRLLRGVEHLELHADAWGYLDPKSGLDLAASMPRLSTVDISGEQSHVQDASEALEMLVSNTALSISTLCLRLLECDCKLLAPLIAATRIRELHLDECLGVEADDVSALRASGVSVQWSEEMSPSERTSLWGNNRGNDGVWTAWGTRF